MNGDGRRERTLEEGVGKVRERTLPLAGGSFSSESGPHVLRYRFPPRYTSSVGALSRPGVGRFPGSFGESEERATRETPDFRPGFPVRVRVRFGFLSLGRLSLGFPSCYPSTRCVFDRKVDLLELVLVLYYPLPRRGHVVFRSDPVGREVESLKTLYPFIVFSSYGLCTHPRVLYEQLTYLLRCTPIPQPLPSSVPHDCRCNRCDLHLVLPSRVPLWTSIGTVS